MKKETTGNVETINTISNIVTAFCLTILTISLLAGGVWTVNTVDGLRSDYHPDKIGKIVDQISETVDTLHHTAGMLKSSHEDFDPILEFKEFSETLQLLAGSINQVPKMVNEAESWRNMSSSGFGHLKRIVQDW
jgi:hypothetical protein